MKPRRYFVTDRWHVTGIVALDLRPSSNPDYVTNISLENHRSRWFHGKIGSSAFEKREDAVTAVVAKAKKKLAAIQKRHAKQVALLERVIADGPDAVFAAPAVAP